MTASGLMLAREGRVGPHPVGTASRLLPTLSILSFPTADYTLEKGDVYWVTMTQLIDWMKNPVPASQLRRSQALCARPQRPLPPPKMPADGANLTLTLKGACERVREVGVGRDAVGNTQVGAQGAAQGARIPSCRCSWLCVA